MKLVIITHERKAAYITTSHFVTAIWLTKSFEVKNPVIFKDIYSHISGHWSAIFMLGNKAACMTVENIREYLEKRTQKIDYEVIKTPGLSLKSVSLMFSFFISNHRQAPGKH